MTEATLPTKHYMGKRNKLQISVSLPSIKQNNLSNMDIKRSDGKNLKRDKFFIKKFRINKLLLNDETIVPHET